MMQCNTYGENLKFCTKGDRWIDTGVSPNTPDEKSCGGACKTAYRSAKRGQRAKDQHLAVGVSCNIYTPAK